MYQTKNYDHVLGLPGFSDQALNTHFALYSGYVKNTNLLLEKLKETEPTTSEYAELKRRLGWEFNGMRMHEYYFDSFAKEPELLEPASFLLAKFNASFGSFDNWLKDFKATALMRGIGWAVLYYDPVSDKLINFWIEQHHNGHPAGLKLILNLDMFEHAFIIDHGIKKSDYVEAFLKVIDWQKVSARI